MNMNTNAAQHTSDDLYRPINYASADGISGFLKLPFVFRDPSKRRPAPGTNWSIPAPGTHTYTEACEVGRAYAIHFAQYLKDNPEMAGDNSLGHVAEDVDFSDKEQSGYWVGFFSLLGELIAMGADRVDLTAQLQRRRHD
ncbi:MAG: hypothetical protein V4751_11575 [Pseudomonadota bacterium]